MENKNEIYIFTDGSSLGNPGHGGWGAVIVADGRVRELGDREKHTTNNRMELSAVIGAFLYLGETKKNIRLHTDSSYVINGITSWVHKWQKNRWKNSEKEDVKNRDLWEDLIKISEGKKIEWKHVAGHVGVSGNERADKIATAFASGKKEELYDGNFTNYQYQNILDISPDVFQKKARTKTKARSKAKAYSYLSLIGGKVTYHKTWAECERLVKGKPAKFKKALTKEDEGKILKEWGIK